MPAKPISRIDNILNNPIGDDLINFKPFQPCILNLDTLERLYFQTIPREIRYNPDSTWVAIPSMARNNPNYHYTGSEDTIEFEVSWYANHKSREDVIRKCKWLEALSKNDGNNKRPSPIKFLFGDVFSESKFIVAKAPYLFNSFNREFNMLPCLAVQQVTLKKITSGNLTTNEIRKTKT